MDNRPVTVPVHANRMKLYYDPSERPITAPHPAATLPDLSDAHLPPDSFEILEPVEPGASIASTTRGELSQICRQKGCGHKFLCNVFRYPTLGRKKNTHLFQREAFLILLQK